MKTILLLLLPVILFSQTKLSDSKDNLPIPINSLLLDAPYYDKTNETYYLFFRFNQDYYLKWYNIGVIAYSKVTIYNGDNNTYNRIVLQNGDSLYYYALHVGNGYASDIYATNEDGSKWLIPWDNVPKELTDFEIK